jgi:lipid-A-disaccharide synthase-like uncharacterized protein
MSILGLIMIAIAWLIQFLLMTKKDNSVQNLFLFIYGLGTLVLVYDAFTAGMTEVAMVNVSIAALSAAVLYKQNHR